MKTIYTLLLAVLLSGTAFAQTGLRVGAKVPDFTLKDARNQSVPLSSFNDSKLVVVVFTSVKCPYAKSYESRLQSLDKAYSGRGVSFVYVNAVIGLQEGNAAKAQPDAANTSGQDFPYLVDEGQQLSKMFGATKTPEVFVLENTADGFMLRYKGAIDDNPQVESYVKDRYLATALDNLIAGRAVSNPDRRATGCTIKPF